MRRDSSGTPGSGPGSRPKRGGRAGNGPGTPETTRAGRADPMRPSHAPSHAPAHTHAPPIAPGSTRARGPACAPGSARIRVPARAPSSAPAYAPPRAPVVTGSFQTKLTDPTRQALVNTIIRTDPTAPSWTDRGLLVLPASAAPHPPYILHILRSGSHAECRRSPGGRPRVRSPGDRPLYPAGLGGDRPLCPNGLVGDRPLSSRARRFCLGCAHSYLGQAHVRLRSLGLPGPRACPPALAGSARAARMSIWATCMSAPVSPREPATEHVCLGQPPRALGRS